MKTIRKNGKEYKREMLRDDRHILKSSLHNNFSKERVQSIPSYQLEMGRLTLDENSGVYTLHIHSNLWYTWAK